VQGINILAPREPYVCIGYHQDLGQEVDVAFCQEQGIPIFRREVGGGAVYLDGHQIFYQIVLHKDHPLAQRGKTAFYQRLLQPVADTYTDRGVPARYRPVNDVITAEGRKIAGTGAATIGDYVILVGNLIADFDYQTMARVLRVPDEKFRDKVFKSIQENLTTLKRELGRLPTWDEMAGPLIRRFESVLGPLQQAELPQAVYDQAEMLKARF
jgi:lipoate-protein ligase A